MRAISHNDVSFSPARVIFIFVCLWMVTMALVQSACGQQKVANGPVAGRYIVVLNDGVKTDDVLSTYKITADQKYDRVLNGFSTNISEEGSKVLAKDRRVKYVEQDTYVSVTMDKGTRAAMQALPTWNLDRIDQRAYPLDGAYSPTATGKGVTAYIIDSGIRPTHNEFGGRAQIAGDFVGDGQNGNDCLGHGTHVAGIVGSEHYGVAPGVQIRAIRVLGCDGFGQVSAMLQAVNWITANAEKPAVVNISIALSGPSVALDTGIQNSISSGIVYAIAAGNYGRSTCGYTPSRILEAIVVGSVTDGDIRPGYSNQGDCLDIYAPGQFVLSTYNYSDDGLQYLSGTSMASPHVAGAAALLLEDSPRSSPATIERNLLRNATVGVVTNVDETLPNRLLFVGVVRNGKKR